MYSVVYNEASLAWKFRRDYMPYHGADPFSGVDGAMEEHSRLRPFSSTSPDMNTSQRSAVDRCAGRDDFRLASESGLQVSQELDVVGIRVVCSEPRLAWDCEGIRSAMNAQCRGPRHG